MNPLPQYGAFEFLPYSSKTTLESTSTCAPTPEHTQPPVDEQLQVNSASTWSYCGPVLTSSSADLPPSFHTWSELTFSAPSILLDRLIPLLSFLQTFLSSAGAHHYWLTIRATKPTSEFDTPRWHTDDNFFAQDNSSQPRHWKLAATLLGPSTLFLTASAHGRQAQSEAKRVEREKRGDHTCNSVRCVGCADAGDAVRQTLAEALCGEEVVRPGHGEVAFFRIGDEDGAVHSEPKCDVDRVFVNVTPGTEAGLRALMGRWEMGFPRAWCFGLPVGFVVSDEMGDVVTSGEGRNVEGREREAVRAGLKSSPRSRMREECQGWLDRKGFRFVNMFN